MAKITLVTENGKWKYETTTDDELFSPILGAMVEDGMTLPSVLVLYNSVAEILERDWHLVGLIRQWMEWEKELNKPYSIADLFEIGGEKLKLVWRHQLTQIEPLLSLPQGWETYVAVDKRSNEKEYLAHIHASYAHLTHERSRTWRMLKSSFDSETLEILSTYAGGMTPDRTDSLRMAPFLRNLWLQHSPSPLIFMSTVLNGLDWDIVEKYIVQAENGLLYKISQLSEVMQGRGYMFNHQFDYIQTIWYNKGILSCLGDNNSTNLMNLYRLLLPRVSSFKLLGLEVILGYKSSSYDVSTTSSSTSNTIPLRGTGLSRLVGWVNTTIIAYPSMSKIYEKNKRPTSLLRVRLARKHFSDSVELLGKTVGIAVIRVIISSLQRARAMLDAYHDKTLIKKRERVSEYITLLYKHISTHKGEYEGMRSLTLVDK